MPIMKKIAVASIIHETCSFNNALKTTLRDFKKSYFKLGPDVVNVPSNERVVGGFVAATKPRNFQLEGIIAAFAGAGADLSAETYAELKDILLAGIRNAGRLDAVLLVLMGGMTAEGEPDTEGVMLGEVRKLVGKDCMIAVVLDHHGNVTQRMVEAADVMLGHDTQPHDLPASGVKAARVMLDIWENKRTPHGALVKVPMITPQDQFLTAGGPMKEWFDLARKIERDPAVIVASPFPTQPWLDAPDNGWSCLVYADDAATARGYAEQLAQKAWDLRAQFWRSERLSLSATVAAANAEPKGLVVISDTGDSSWGGAPGDNTSLIAEMLKSGLSGTALVPMVDPAALEQAIKAGIGRKITVQLGAMFSAEYSPRLEITGVVRAIAGAGERDFGDGTVSQAGRSVLFECGHLKIVITEFRDYAVNHPLFYEVLGVDVGKAKMVVLKTASNFQYFKPYQSRLIRADSPGATQSDLTKLRWQKITRPIYPLDDIKDWRPR
jgi:microcystin degradation protein MlrC